MIVNKYTDTSISAEKAPDKPMTELMWLLEQMNIDLKKIEIIEYEDGKRSVKIPYHTKDVSIVISVLSDRYILHLRPISDPHETDLLGAYVYLYFMGYRPKKVKDHKEMDTAVLKETLDSVGLQDKIKYVNEMNPITDDVGICIFNDMAVPPGEERKQVYMFSSGTSPVFFNNNTELLMLLKVSGVVPFED